MTQYFSSLADVAIFKTDRRLNRNHGKLYLNTNEFVGVTMGLYDPEKRKWHR